MAAPALEFSGQVTCGRLPAAVSEKIAAVIRRMDGKRLVISVREQKRRRSLNQNAYYWGVVVELVTQMFVEAGNSISRDDVHDFLKQHVGKLEREIHTPDGEVVTTLGSTAALTTQEFEVYLEKIRAWAAEFGLVIPLPGEVAE